VPGAHRIATFAPVTVAVNGLGGPATGAGEPTLTTTSLDGPLRPARLAARRRTKYAPTGMVTLHVVSRTLVLNTGSVVEPDDSPPSTT
jgi:hypothetical protein